MVESWLQLMTAVEGETKLVESWGELVAANGCNSEDENGQSKALREMTEISCCWAEIEGLRRS
ncbi:hypothetical protein AMTR_s00005p00084720 [Amborella trichopoda]|uniref:Uncharacterized protein n=1 Tax=Amborella trichopoda TaxID=13333 RepID=W1PGJ6_AMBTC|nr:hypothetical protein AMTR_s00005p00084720 [Amborella trichopoda]